VLENIFGSCEACLGAGLRNFETSVKQTKLNCGEKTTVVEFVLDVDLQ
jgi:hypothetical protein